MFFLFFLRGVGDERVLVTGKGHQKGFSLVRTQRSFHLLKIVFIVMKI